jgi:hypothetical protein
VLERRHRTPAGWRPHRHGAAVPGVLAGRSGHRRAERRRPGRHRGFGLDEGESIGALLAQGGPPAPALAHLDVDKQGFAWRPENDFVYHFSADAVQARVLHAVQQPLGTTTFQDVMGVPA